MKITYIANIRMPTEKAHGIQIMKTCEALAELGHNIELIVPDRKTDITEDPFSYYGVKTRFMIRRLAVWDTIHYGKIGFLVESFLFVHAVRRHLRGSSADVFYGRDELILACLHGPYAWESHTGAWNLAAQHVARRAKCIVAISRGLKEFYVEKGISPDKIIVAHDGIDLKQFENPQSKAEARVCLGIPLDTKVAMYIGRLDGWKGIDTLLAASTFLPHDTMLVIVGGEPMQIAEMSRRYPNVRFLGFRPYRELADTMAAADALVLPNTGKDEISVKFTSPLKLFAYMTSGVPMVASDLPSIREVLDEHSAFLVTPDDAPALASGIQQALEGGSERAAYALARVADYSWKHRAERIVAAL